jgi:ABC-type transporter Mla maintaining outer membrane lipid asymmetry ATPase subunit MlaF
MLPRLVEICSKYIKSYVTCRTALSILLFSLAHNAEQLESYCTHFIAKNRTELEANGSLRQFLERSHPKLRDSINSKIDEECNTSFV